MASEIIRDGVKYTCLQTFEFTDDDEVIEHEGGEITDEMIDSILAKEREDEELDAQEAELAREEYEVHHLTREERELLKKAKNLLKEGD